MCKIIYVGAAFRRRLNITVNDVEKITDEVDYVNNLSDVLVDANLNNWRNDINGAMITLNKALYMPNENKGVLGDEITYVLTST